MSVTGFPPDCRCWQIIQSTRRPPGVIILAGAPALCQPGENLTVFTKVFSSLLCPARAELQLPLDSDVIHSIHKVTLENFTFLSDRIDLAVTEMRPLQMHVSQMLFTPRRSNY